MHICMLLGKFREDALKTGADIQAELQINSLLEKGHTITVIAKKNNISSNYFEKFQDCDVYRVGPPGLRSIMTSLLLFFLRKRFDIVHIHGQHTFSVVAIALCSLLNIPTVLKITIAGRVFVRAGLDKLFPRKWRILRRLINRLARLASAYIAISNEIADELPRANFFAYRIRRIPNGVDTTRFSPVDEKTKQRLQDALGLPKHKKIVLYASRLTHRKGYDLLLKAWPTVYAQYSDTHLVIVGGGKDDLQKDVNCLCQKVPRDSFTYIGQVADTAPYLQSSDIYLFPSRKEGLPNGLIEAMACGCACVASDIGGCKDLVTPRYSGLLFPSSDAAALAEAICMLLADAALAKSLGRNASHYINKHYDIKSVAGQIDALYKSLLTNPAAPTISVPPTTYK